MEIAQQQGQGAGIWFCLFEHRKCSNTNILCSLMAIITCSPFCPSHPPFVLQLHNPSGSPSTTALSILELYSLTINFNSLSLIHIGLKVLCIVLSKDIFTLWTSSSTSLKLSQFSFIGHCLRNSASLLHLLLSWFYLTGSFLSLIYLALYQTSNSSLSLPWIGCTAPFPCNKCTHHLPYQYLFLPRSQL